MNVIDRRSVLRGLVGGVVAAGVGGELLIRSAEALPSAELPAARPVAHANNADAPTYAQFMTPGPAPVRPPRRPPPRRRRRRWVCWWHRGRRHCGWRWR